MIIMAIADTRAGVKRVFSIVFMFVVSMGVANIVLKTGQSIHRNLYQAAFVVGILDVLLCTPSSGYPLVGVPRYLYSISECDLALMSISACRKRLSVVDSPHANSETESTATRRQNLHRVTGLTHLD